MSTIPLISVNPSVACASSLRVILISPPANTTQQILTALDTADDAVNDALQQLREIQIDPHLQAQLATDNPIKAPGPPAGSSKDSSKGSLKADTGHQSRPPSQPKDQTQTLYALVSPTPLETIRSQIRQHIDAITAATASITSVINTLASHTTTVHRTLDSPEDDAESQHISLEKSAIREIFTTLEDKASESAQSLQSLITHYDLCVKAVRNTEGGGEAVSTHDGVEGERLDVQGDEPLISEEERVELLAVISKDAGEVDDVVSEIDDAGREMEVLSGELSEHLLYLQSESQRLDKAKRLLEACAPELKGCGRAGEVFWRTMEGELEGIREGLRGLEEVGRGFGGFREGYGRMVGELGRRGEFERRMGRMYEGESHFTLCVDDDGGRNMGLVEFP